MGIFSLLKKDKIKLLKEDKIELTDEQKKQNKMWDLWAENCAVSPYAELMTYLSEIDNGGHAQYFSNVENSGDLQKEMAVLETVLPTKLCENLKSAYDAYSELTGEESDKQADAILDQCDNVFYENEDIIDCMLEEYAHKIEL